jgi:HAE1 family hydrophobic/amphiphilic exporter-1
MPARMAAYGIAAQDISDAFGREHIQFAGGFLVGRSTEHLVKLDLEFHNLDDLAAMIVGHKDGAPVRLRDIAEVEDGLADFRQLARFNGKPTVGIGVVKVPNTNTVEIIDKIVERIDQEIRPQLPPGLELHYVQNDKVFIGEMVAALKSHLIEGTLLAALIVWLFLKSLRSTLIIATAIPVSLMGAIGVMYFFGYTFNSVTLLALLLLVGVVVDDSIVVLENIYRHREEDAGATAMSAAITGSQEVTFAVIAASFSLVAIFAPVLFIGGILGQFLRSFAVVVSFGVLVSLFVSLTLTPMLCSRFLQVAPSHGKVYWMLEHFFQRMEAFYRRCLEGGLRHRGLMLAGGAATFVAAVLAALFLLPKELAPQQD